MASMDIDVHIFFRMEGVRLMQRGVADGLRTMEGGTLIIDFVRDAKRAGVPLHVCHPALPGYKIKPDQDLIPEVDEVNRASELADLVLRSDRTLTF
jgi:predicted peroxiredoxin